MNLINKKKTKNNIWTVPNMLSLFRLALIPFIIRQYCLQKQYLFTAILLLISGLTDIIDGWIARKFNMISNVGKALDPIADKLTQLTMLVCLIMRFPLMILPAVLLIAKELLAGIIGLVTVHKTHDVPSAKWHGKLCTVLLYLTIMVHTLWYSIPSHVSYVLILASAFVMLFSSVLYTVSGICRLKHQSQTPSSSTDTSSDILP